MVKSFLCYIITKENMAKFIIILSYFLCHFQYTIADCTKENVTIPMAHDCADQLEDVLPTNHQLGDHLALSSLCSCSPGQQYITDHLDHLTGQYRVISHSFRTTINITKFEDGGIYRFYCNGSSSCCYLKINVLPQSVQLYVSEAIVNQSFNASCLAIGYPAPKVDIAIDCQPNIFTRPQPFQLNNYTMKTVISVNELPARCSTISCYSYHINCIEAINYTVVTDPSVEPTTVPAEAATKANNNFTDYPTTTTDYPTTVPAGAATKATNKMIMLILLIPIIPLL